MANPQTPLVNTNPNAPTINIAAFSQEDQLAILTAKAAYENAGNAVTQALIAAQMNLVKAQQAAPVPAS